MKRQLFAFGFNLDCYERSEEKNIGVQLSILKFIFLKAISLEQSDEILTSSYNCNAKVQKLF